MCFTASLRGTIPFTRDESSPFVTEVKRGRMSMRLRFKIPFKRRDMSWKFWKNCLWSSPRFVHQGPRWIKSTIVHSGTALWTMAWCRDRQLQLNTPLNIANQRGSGREQAWWNGKSFETRHAKWRWARKHNERETEQFHSTKARYMKHEQAPDV